MSGSILNVCDRSNVEVKRECSGFLNNLSELLAQGELAPTFKDFNVNLKMDGDRLTFNGGL